MKIATIYTQSVGPLGDAEISFENDWTGKVDENVLFTGPNGCGKSTLLRGVAMLWDALGYWLDHQKTMPASHSARKWLERWGTFAVVFSDLQCSDQSPIRVGLFFGNESAIDKIIAKQPYNTTWIGEVNEGKKKTRTKTRSGFVKDYVFDEWLQTLSITRVQVVLGRLNSGMALSVPNIIYLDAEERRWITPKSNISSLAPDDLSKNWLATYSPSSDWKGQLEASLFNMKATLPELYPKMIKTLNQFFSGKVIVEEIQPGQRQQVKLANGDTHTLDEMSSGEHQVLIMLFMVQRWLQPGGIVLIDEPDLHLHPSLVSPLLATLENIIQKKQGQLILTSHATDVWQRYENLGIRKDLSRLKEAGHGQN